MSAKGRSNNQIGAARKRARHMGDRKGITRAEVILRRACVPSKGHSQGLEQEVHVDLDSLLEVDWVGPPTGGR